jgi:predicted amidohydrolase YtcJ
MEALRLYTVENGWFTHEEAQLGTIEVGKLADLAVLSADYFDQARVGDEAIKQIRSVLTVVDGRVVHDQSR